MIRPENLPSKVWIWWAMRSNRSWYLCRTAEDLKEWNGTTFSSEYDYIEEVDLTKGREGEK